MAANPATDFDLGPLTWVKTEIDHSLNQARENLDKLAANPADRAPVKYILTHLHQATGALAMVGLGAATRFNEELEKLVAYLEGEDAARLPGSVAVAKKGISALSQLPRRAAGAAQPDHPMRLLGAVPGAEPRARRRSTPTRAISSTPTYPPPLPPLPETEAARRCGARQGAGAAARAIPARAAARPQGRRHRRGAAPDARRGHRDRIAAGAPRRTARSGPRPRDSSTRSSSAGSTSLRRPSRSSPSSTSR